MAFLDKVTFLDILTFCLLTEGVTISRNYCISFFKNSFLKVQGEKDSIVAERIVGGKVVTDNDNDFAYMVSTVLLKRMNISYITQEN